MNDEEIKITVTDNYSDLNVQQLEAMKKAYWGKVQTLMKTVDKIYKLANKYVDETIKIDEEIYIKRANKD